MSEVLTYDEAAAYLRYSRRKLEGLVSAREIPSVLDGNRRTFRKAALDAWLIERERASMRRSRKLEVLHT